MKSLKTAVFTTLLLVTGLAFGQATGNPKFPANANGAVMADEFGKWAFQSQTGISSGAQTVTLNGCYIKVGTSYEQFYPIAVNVPLYITDGTNSEAITPTAVTRVNGFLWSFGCDFRVVPIEVTGCKSFILR